MSGRWTEAQAFSAGKRGTWPMDLGVGYTDGQPPTCFQGFFFDRRVARKMSRRLGVRFRVMRDERTRWFEMRVTEPTGALAAFIQGMESSERGDLCAEVGGPDCEC